jgi:hypothetical protein
VGSLGVFVLLVAAIITFVIGALYGKGLLGCNETVAEQKGPKGKIGQTVKFSNVAWQVTSARQATLLKAPSRVAANGSAFRNRQVLPAKQKKGNFVIVDFLFTNNADEATRLDSATLSLLDGEGCEFEIISDDFAYIAPGKNIFSEKVNPGVTQDGQVIFTVTPEAKDFTLRAGDTDPFITDENAYIELGF